MLQQAERVNTLCRGFGSNGDVILARIWRVRGSLEEKVWDGLPVSPAALIPGIDLYEGRAL